MFYLHLFGCGSFLTLPSSHYVTIFKNYDSAIAASGKICIALFLFCSGYGLYRSYIEKPDISESGNIKRIIKFCISYWCVMFFIAMPYLKISGKLNMDYFFMNLFALLHNDEMLYVSFSWYVKLHLGLLIGLPLMRHLNKKITNVLCQIALYILLPFLTLLSFGSLISEKYYQGIWTFLISSCIMVFSYLPLFATGLFFAKYNVYEKIKGRIKAPRTFKFIISFAGIIILLLSRNKFHLFEGKITEAIYASKIQDVVYAPLLALFWLAFLDALGSKIINKIINFIGKYSFQYWLISGMFFLNTSELQWILYLPKYSVLILVWSFLIMTPCAVLCEKLSQILFRSVMTGFEKTKASLIQRSKL